MATPSPKAPAIDSVLTSISGRSRPEAIEHDICVSCGRACPPELFRDDLSKREYEISGLCQSCQDNVFGSPSDDDQSEFDEIESRLE